jgi:hypothetical protein
MKILSAMAMLLRNPLSAKKYLRVLSLKAPGKFRGQKFRGQTEVSWTGSFVDEVSWTGSCERIAFAKE